MVFPCREVIFSKLFYCQQPQATESSEKCCLSRISDHVREFFGVVLELARPSEAWCFPAGSDFFEAVLLLAAAGNRIYRKMLFF